MWNGNMWQKAFINAFGLFTNGTLHNENYLQLLFQSAENMSLDSRRGCSFRRPPIHVGPKSDFSFGLNDLLLKIFAISKTFLPPRRALLRVNNHYLREIQMFL